MVLQREQGEITEKGGIVSAKVVDYAAALDTTAEDFLEALERTAITPLVDTAKAEGKRRKGKAPDRSNDSSIRCLAFEVEDYRRLAAAVGAAEALEGQSVSAAA